MDGLLSAKMLGRSPTKGCSSFRDLKKPKLLYLSAMRIEMIGCQAVEFCTHRGSVRHSLPRNFSASPTLYVS